MANFFQKWLAGFGKTEPATPKSPNTGDQSVPRSEPTIWLRRESSAQGQSWLGGLPSLPSNVEWPRHGVTGLPLHFLAQIDLSAIPKTPLIPGGPILPANGLLLFFADLDAEMIWDEDQQGTEHDATRVLHVPVGAAPAVAPADLPEVNHEFGEMRDEYSAGFSVFPEKRVKAYLIDTFPDQDEYIQNGTATITDALVMKSIERATGEAVPQFENGSGYKLPASVSYRELANRKREYDFHIIHHQMLGAATAVQGTADEMRERGMISLFQLDSDWGVHNKFMFCDMGMIQFWIGPEDLKARNFQKAFATTEGG
jgi:uncharacterized protein YwqG